MGAASESTETKASTRGRESRTLPGSLIAFVSIAAIFCTVRSLASIGIVDDTYIFSRYGRLAAEGLGLVFNPGERVEGYTSPLWVGVATLVEFFGGSVEALGVLGAVAGILLCWVAFRRCDCGGAAWLPAALLTMSPSVLFWSWSGMDVGLFSLFALLSLILLGDDIAERTIRPITGWALALAFLARPEGLLLLPIAAVAILVQRVSGLRQLAPVVTVILLSLLARYLYYGELLPNTFYAKVPGELLYRWRHGSAYLWEFLVPYGVATALVAVLGVIAYRRNQSDPRIGLLLAWTMITFAYLVLQGGDHFALHRMLVPVLAPMVLAAYMCSIRLANAAWIACVAVAFAAGHIVAFVRAWGPAQEEVAAAKHWAQVGKWLRESIPVQSRVATIPIGAIGYFSHRRILDLSGLTNQHIGKRGRVHGNAFPGHFRYDSDYVLREAPEYVFLGIGGPERFQIELTEGYNYALIDLTRQRATSQMYRYVVCRAAPSLFAHFLVLRTQAASDVIVEPRRP